MVSAEVGLVHRVNLSSCASSERIASRSKATLPFLIFLHKGQLSAFPPAAEVEVAALRERVKNLEELVEYQRQQLTDADWRYQQLLEQLASSQRISENLSRPLPAAEATGELVQHRLWWPFRKAQN